VVLLASVKLDLFVQDKENLSVSEIIKFVDSLDNTKIALFYTALSNDCVLLEFMKEVVDEVKLPFSGMRVTGFFTDNQYFSESIVIAVLSGDFEVQVVREVLDLNDHDGCAKRIIPRVSGWDFALVNSTNYYYDNIKLDAILRRVNIEYEKLQLVGGISCPHPMVFTNDGIFDDSILFTLFKGLDLKYDIYSGYQKKEDSKTHIVTRSDESGIREIDGTNAVSFYCDYKRIRPYFFNMLTALVVKPSMAELVKKLAESSKMMYDGLMKLSIEVLGCELRDGMMEACFFVKYNEKDSQLIPVGYTPKEVKLDWSTSTADNQIKVYDKIIKEFNGYNNLILFPCGYLPFLYYWTDPLLVYH